jgi:replication factor C subunit 2/4
MDVDDDTKMITVKSVEDIAGVIPEATIEGLVKAMQPRSKGLVYEVVAKVVTDMVADGWSATQVVTQVCVPAPLSTNLTRWQLYQSIIYNEAIPDIQKNKIVLLFSESDKRLVDGSDEHLTILDLALRTSNVMAGA